MDIEAYIEQEEERLSQEDDFNEAPPSDIVAYNELRSCADLVRMYQNGQLVIQPDFQRDVVWRKPQQTRFIDSLTKQLPIPSMCISLDYRTDKRLMIDGLQRIYSIIQFLTNDKWKLSRLDDIDERISGKTPEKIQQENSEIYSRIQNLTIPVTLLRCDYAKKNHMHYLFTIFHRLNTGSSRLTNQEIRHCIFQGKLNDLLKKMVQIRDYRKLFSLRSHETYRFRHEELVLRIFAFYDSLEQYDGKLAKFLNDYMDDNKNPDSKFLYNKENMFERTVEIIYRKMYSERSLRRPNKTITESIFVGVAKNLDRLEKETSEQLQERLNILLKDKFFLLENIQAGLSDRRRVIERIQRSIEIFS